MSLADDAARAVILAAENFTMAAREVFGAAREFRIALERKDIDLDAGECDGDCPDGEAAEALEADRDELSATVERLYDGIDAALRRIDEMDTTLDASTEELARILRDLRTTEITAEVPERAPDAIMVDEGWWWHPDVQDGQVHLHTDRQPSTMHRLCAPVYTRRTP